MMHEKNSWIFFHICHKILMVTYTLHQQYINPLSKFDIHNQSVTAAEVWLFFFFFVAYLFIFFSKLLIFLKANKSKLTPTLQWTMFEPGSALWWPPRLCRPIRRGVLWTHRACAPVSTGGVSVCQWEVSACQPCVWRAAGLWLRRWLRWTG